VNWDPIVCEFNDESVWRGSARFIDISFHRDLVRCPVHTFMLLFRLVVLRQAIFLQLRSCTQIGSPANDNENNSPVVIVGHTDEYVYLLVLLFGSCYYRVRVFVSGLLHSTKQSVPC
jgi:hypothetical protein